MLNPIRRESWPNDLGILPVREFLYTAKRSELSPIGHDGCGYRTSETVTGKTQILQSGEKAKLFGLDSFERLEDTGPVSSLTDRLSILSAVQLARDKGSVPVRLLWSRERKARAEQEAKAKDGIGPAIELEERLSVVRWVKVGKLSGNEPKMALFWRLRAITLWLELSRVTPVQLQKLERSPSRQSWRGKATKLCLRARSDSASHGMGVAFRVIGSATTEMRAK
ncbi:hypothetical protein SUGI_0117920 [Cryptomeria japonica]|nr:hypothetical protein SUGI_0117920 [Cryptomeria japonica]